MGRKSVITKLAGSVLSAFLFIMFLVSFVGSGKDYIADTTTQADEVKDSGRVQYVNLSITYEPTMPADVPDQISTAVESIPAEAVRALLDEDWKIAAVSTLELHQGMDNGSLVDTGSIIGVQ